MLLVVLVVGCALAAAWLLIMLRGLHRTRLERETQVIARLAETGQRLRKRPDGR